MLRIIDMTEAICSDEFEFAVWDTVTDSFLKDVFDEQVWTRDGFIEACSEDYPLSRRKDRVLVLLPDNAKDDGVNEVNPDQRIVENGGSNGS